MKKRRKNKLLRPLCGFCGIKRLVDRRDAKTCGKIACIKERRKERYEKTYRKDKKKLRKKWKLAKRKQRAKD